jgi:hypothetical protein
MEENPKVWGKNQKPLRRLWQAERLPGKISAMQNMF